MMCKLHDDDDDDDDDDSIVKTRTCIVASIVFQEYFLQKNPWKYTVGAPRGFGDLKRMAISFQGAGNW